MARARFRQKNIACLESLWDQDIEDRLNVVPILELASKASKKHKVKYIYLTCNTSEELKYNLNKLKRKRGYGILYLAFHGNPGEIVLDEAPIDLETLAALMGKGFADWVVHFSTCGTLDTERHRISNFITATRASMVVGYKKNVNWIDSAAIDLLLLDWLQYYRDMRSLWIEFKRSYPDLISNTGLRVFHR